MGLILSSSHWRWNLTSQKETARPFDRAALKGASRGGYHTPKGRRGFPRPNRTHSLRNYTTRTDAEVIVACALPAERGRGRSPSHSHHTSGTLLGADALPRLLYEPAGREWSPFHVRRSWHSTPWRRSTPYARRPFRLSSFI